MKSRSLHFASKHKPRGFESLEPRYALDATTAVSLNQEPLPNLAPAAMATPGPAIVALPTVGQTQSLPLLGMRVYAAPIGPVQAPAQPAALPSSPSISTLPPMTPGLIQRLGLTPLGSGNMQPIGPAQPATLPAAPLYAEGFLPTNTTPANLPTERQTMPDIPEPPGPPSFTPITSFPLY